jgi:uncharacterized damage-inducible protein DinB
LPAEPASVAEVLDRVQIEWAALQDVVSRLSDESLSAPGPEVWAIKDHLAHIADWERGCTAVLAHIPQYEAFGMSASQYAALDPDIDGFNAALYERHRAESVGEVKALANAAHAEMIAAIARLEDADLRRSVAEYGMMTNPQRRLIEKIAGDTYDHYAEHTVWINQLLSSQAQI